MPSSTDCRICIVEYKNKIQKYNEILSITVVSSSERAFCGHDTDRWTEIHECINKKFIEFMNSATVKSRTTWCRDCTTRARQITGVNCLIIAVYIYITFIINTVRPPAFERLLFFFSRTFGRVPVLRNETLLKITINVDARNKHEKPNRAIRRYGLLMKKKRN